MTKASKNPQVSFFISKLRHAESILPEALAHLLETLVCHPKDIQDLTRSKRFDYLTYHGLHYHEWYSPHLFHSVAALILALFNLLHHLLFFRITLDLGSKLRAVYRVIPIHSSWFLMHQHQLCFYVASSFISTTSIFGYSTHYESLKRCWHTLFLLLICLCLVSLEAWHCGLSLAQCFF